MESGSPTEITVTRSWYARQNPLQCRLPKPCHRPTPARQPSHPGGSRLRSAGTSPGSYAAVAVACPVRAPRPGSPSDDVAAMAYKWDSSVTASPRAGPRRVPRGPLPEGVPQVRRDDGEIRALRLLRRSLPVVRYLVSTPGRCPPPFFGAAAAAAAEPLRAAAEAPRPAAAAAAAAARRRRPS